MSARGKEIGATAGHQLVVSARATDRRAASLAWLSALPRHADALILGETLDGPHDLILAFVSHGGSAMGLHRRTLRLLAAELARTAGAAERRPPGGRLARSAIVERTLRRVTSERLGRLGAVADTPGFGRAVGDALDDLGLARATPAALRPLDADLAGLAEAVREEWEEAGLLSLSDVYHAAIERLGDIDFKHPLTCVPLLVQDARIETGLETAFLGALLERAPASLTTIPDGDAVSIASYESLRIENSRMAGEPGGTGHRALDRLQTGLFGAPGAPTAPDDSVTVFSAPGESRESVEIARRLLAAAEEGRRFDSAAILLRQPEDYRPYLEEALDRADVPAYFARGVRRPDPAGRAFLALLSCRLDDYSALRFAEYLSIGEVPAAAEGDAPPDALSEAETWVPPVDEEQRPPGETALSVETLPPAETAPAGGGAGADGGSGGEGDRAVRAHTLRVPRRWERLLVEASVVGGLDRWSRRLDSLEAELELRRDGLEVEDPDDPRRRAIDRDLGDLACLRAYALPLLEALSELPDEATWERWLAALRGLATRALHRPRTVLALLGELAPMGPIGPVTLPEVVRTLAPRLREAAAASGGGRYGKVFVGPIDAARGLAFDLVFVPGMAERVFPPKIAEDPILLDGVREALNQGDRSGAGPGLATNRDRVAAERLALRIAVGAARERVVLSYPRIEAIKSRPRVPSFYVLEAVRAAEGRLPTFEDLAKRAEEVAEARIGWPAPKAAERAIDEAEYDLAVLADLGVRGEAAVKAAGHLLNTNRHLARALRFRAYRWEVPRWTWADGLIDLSEGAMTALAAHAPDARPFSATALQHFAACPYRFYLQAIQRLSPRELPVGIETMDPLQRGSLVHQVQFELLTRLQAEGAGATAAEAPLPVRPETLERALDALDVVLREVAATYEDRLVPAIDKVWDDGIESIRQDLREWLDRESRDPSPFEPYRFELSFGLPIDADRDEHSRPEPVDLGVGLTLRGAIDLVERTPDRVLRVTDHKTGRFRAKRDAIIQGGELLQPVLYALAARRLFPDHAVESGRLYYCTTDGEYRSHEVPLADHTVEAARVLSGVLRHAFDAGAFPALPRARACEWCDYRAICGPDEERRVRRKPSPVELEQLREFP
ncbi:MAG: PD-(D/E)XK nuclease family protein [Gemmatimonadota bacterium]|nr:PD-(D/E)XK nuclease family protein [Gemmatimonadota bacterium]